MDNASKLISDVQAPAVIEVDISRQETLEMAVVTKEQPPAENGEVATMFAPVSETVPIGRSHPPLCDVIAGKLRNSILAGNYTVGERLVEDRLAQEFAVSRNPIREALRTLATEGLVEITPRCGATVATMSEEVAREMIEVRATLEALNARLAARRHDAKTIADLKRVLDKGANLATASVGDVKKLNAEFHDLLAEAGGNSILGELMRSLRDRAGLIFASASRAEIEATWEEHAAIIKAVVAGDEELAALLSSRHVTRLGDRFLTDLK